MLTIAVSRARRQRAQQRLELDLAAVHEAQAGSEHGLQSDRAGACFGKGQPLGFDVLRIVIRHYHVDQAAAERLDQQLAVVFGAQRRRQFQEGAIGPDVVFVKGDVIDRG